MYARTTLPPNTGLERTALCADKIGAFLKAGFRTIAFPIYWCAAAQAQAVRPPRNRAMPPTADLHAIARQMKDAQDSTKQLAPFTAQHPGFNLPSAYTVAHLIHDM